MRSPINISEDEKIVLKKGSWSNEEDEMLKAYITRYGIWNWSHMPKYAGLSRSGKSCRLRWMNYLKPNVKRGKFSKEDEDIILHSHSLLGNRWSAIASKLPGRSDNEIKNYWHTHLKKRSTTTLMDQCQTTFDIQNTNHHGKKDEINDSSNNSSSYSINSKDHEDDEISDDIQNTNYDHVNNNDHFGSLFVQTNSEDDNSCSSNSSSSYNNNSFISKDHEADDCYDICSPGTLEDLQCFWKQCFPLENMELGTTDHQDTMYPTNYVDTDIFPYSYNDHTTDLYNHDYYI